MLGASGKLLVYVGEQDDCSTHIKLAGVAAEELLLSNFQPAAQLCDGQAKQTIQRQFEEQTGEV